MKITQGEIKKIKKFALDYYKKQDETHNIWHAYKTIKLAKFIAKKEKADIHICELGALLHQFHPENVSIVKNFLKKIKIEQKIMKQLVHCVECVTVKTIHKAKTLEAKVVFDADKLQVLGPFGLVRELSYLNKVEGINFLEAVSKIKEIQRSRYEKLQTNTAKQIAKHPYKLAMKFLEEITL